MINQALALADALTALADVLHDEDDCGAREITEGFRDGLRGVPDGCPPRARYDTDEEHDDCVGSWSLGYALGQKHKEALSS